MPNVMLNVRSRIWPGNSTLRASLSIECATRRPGGTGAAPPRCVARSGDGTMLITLIRLSGLARGLGSLKVRLEDKADDALTQAKSIATRVAIAAALALAALVFAILALLIGLIALYAYLYP